jgi:hypothetical protein
MAWVEDRRVVVSKVDERRDLVKAVVVVFGLRRGRGRRSAMIY